MKTCITCHVEQPLEAYGKDRTSKDGLQYKCNTCRAAYRAANRESLAAKQQAYREDNCEKELARHKKYREANRDLINQRKRAKYAEVKREEELWSGFDD